MIIDNLYIRLIFHSMTLIYYDIVMIKVNFCKNPYIFTNKKNRKCTCILILTLLIRKILILIIRDLQKKKKKFNKRFAITLHKSSIYRNQIKSSSREFQFVQILLNFPHRYFHKNSV